MEAMSIIVQPARKAAATSSGCKSEKVIPAGIAKVEGDRREQKLSGTLFESAWEEAMAIIDVQKRLGLSSHTLGGGARLEINLKCKKDYDEYIA